MNIDELPSDHRMANGKELDAIADIIQDDLIHSDTPCEAPPHGYYCDCWHSGQERYCHCDADVPQEREAIRRP